MPANARSWAARTAGIAVITASRVRERASPGEVFVSSTVHDLLSGSGIEVADRGVSARRRRAGDRGLYAVTGRTDDFVGTVELLPEVGFRMRVEEIDRAVAACPQGPLCH